MKTGARFSPCRKWRYALWRIWDESLPVAVFIMMNPSTADEIKNDPTVQRCQERAYAWYKMGYMKVGGVVVVNVFAWRETDSRKLSKLAAKGIYIVGDDNNRTILHACRKAAIVICAWGKTGHFLMERGKRVYNGLKKNGIELHALKMNKDGSPQHPLYLSYKLKPIRFA